MTTIEPLTQCELNALERKVLDAELKRTASDGIYVDADGVVLDGHTARQLLEIARLMDSYFPDVD